MGASAYKLELPPSMARIHNVFNGYLLKQANEPEFEEQQSDPPPPPIIVDNQEEYEVAEVLDSRLHRGKLQFLVKWVGYTEATWQPESDLGNAQEAVADFYRLHPGAPRKAHLPQRNLRQIFMFTSPEGLTGWSGRPTLGRG